MAPVNTRRVWLGALAGWVVWLIWSAITNFAVLMPRYAAAQKAGTLLTQPRYPFFMVAWFVMLFVLAAICAWLYAGVRATRGAGPEDGALSWVRWWVSRAASRSRFRWRPGRRSDGASRSGGCWSSGWGRSWRRWSPAGSTGTETDSTTGEIGFTLSVAKGPTALRGAYRLGETTVHAAGEVRSDPAQQAADPLGKRVGLGQETEHQGALAGEVEEVAGVHGHAVLVQQLEDEVLLAHDRRHAQHRAPAAAHWGDA